MKEEIKKLKFDLQLFGGGTSVSQRELTEEEKDLIKTQSNYVKSIQPGVNALVSQGTSLMGQVINPDYNTLYSNARTALADYTGKINTLAQGTIPSNYTDAKKNYYNTMYTNSLGNLLASKANTGVIGSSVMNKSVDQMQKNMTTQMSQDYSSDLQTQQGLLSSQLSAAFQPMSLANSANASTFGNVGQYLGLASGQGSQGNQTLSAIGNTINGGTFASSDSGFFGGLASGIGSFMACFVAGTKIATPDGEINIEDVKIGDKVLSFDDELNCVEEEVTWIQEPMISPDNYLTITFDDGTELTTTDTQNFYIMFGTIPAGKLQPGYFVVDMSLFKEVVKIDMVSNKVPVYDLSTTGANMYFANGLAVEGRNNK